MPGSSRAGPTPTPKRDDIALLIAQCRALVRLNPNDADAHYKLGGVLLTYGNIDEAISELRLAILNNPDFGQAHMSLGGALLRKGQKDEAMRELKRGSDLLGRYP